MAPTTVLLLALIPSSSSLSSRPNANMRRRLSTVFRSTSPTLTGHGVGPTRGISVLWAALSWILASKKCSSKTPKTFCGQKRCVHLSHILNDAITQRRERVSHYTFYFDWPLTNRFPVVRRPWDSLPPWLSPPWCSWVRKIIFDSCSRWSSPTRCLCRFLVGFMDIRLNTYNTHGPCTCTLRRAPRRPWCCIHP